ncbi:MAG: hypothetical protein ACLR15_09000 [Lachnospiraceae bacterium]
MLDGKVIGKTDIVAAKSVKKGRSVGLYQTYQKENDKGR